jgi:iron complex outermembrane receptor protein
MARPRVRRDTFDRAWRVFASLATLAIAVSSSAETAVPMRVSDPGPAFYAAPAEPGLKPKRLDTARTTVLSQRIRVDLHAATIPDALAAIAQQSGLRFTYDRALLRATARVTLSSDAVTVASALTHVLRGVNVDVDLAGDGLASLVARHPREGGSITGRVSDSKTGQGIANATLLLEGLARGATTNDSGVYRITNVAPGSYTLAARFLGYVESRTAVTVVAGQPVIVDIALVQSANQLDQVVVAGTVVPTEVKAVPTPVSVITSSDIDLQRPQTVVQLFRQAVPSAVAWDFPTNPDQTTFAVRGASSLDIGGGSMKVYLDGIQITDRTLAAVDPQSIDRIEVLRGPEAATIYGSDAISGVLLITTKRGVEGLNRPQIDLQVAAGVVESPYAHEGGGDVARQEYSGSLTGGTQTASYNFGGGYATTGNWVSQGATYVPSVFGSVHLTQGQLAITVSGRDYGQREGQAFPPDLAATGVPTYAKPPNVTATSEEQTLGASFAFTPFSWWRHSVTVGVDRASSGTRQTAPALTTPADTFLTVYNDNASKLSVAYNTSVAVALSRGVSTTVTVGADHYELDDDNFFSAGALNTSGTIQTDPNQPFVVGHLPVMNAGVFAQTQLGIADQLFLTAGVRAERNSSFGQSLGTPVSPRYGVSYAPVIGNVTLKVRASYGQAIRPPSAEDESAFVTPFALQLANSRLAPERQSGWDTGIDLAVAGKGSFSATYYDQVATDLIEGVTVNADTTPIVQQFQNLGRVRNQGIELEATYRIPIGQLSAQYAITDSRVESLNPTYGGDLKIGDTPLAVPGHTAGVSIAVTPLRGASVTVGLSDVGSWKNYDTLAELDCIGGTGPCPASSRGFIKAYPQFAKANIAITQQITAVMSAFVSVKNVTNNEVYEFFNATPIQGRVTVAGLHVRY